MDALAAAPATASQTTVDAINNSWLAYEGNIRVNDAAAYLSAEDALALFSKAALADDTAGMTAAAAAFRTMAQTYTAAHPG
jgi:ketosteroid isomerase-like protein